MTSGEFLFQELVATVQDPPASLIRRTFGEPLFHTEGEVAALGFTPDGHLWSVDETGALCLWDLQGRLHQRHFLSDLETLWCFSPDAGYLASGTDELILWDLRTASILQRMDQPQWLTALAFSKDSKWLATGHDDGTLRVYHVEPFATRHNVVAHGSPISALAWHPNGQQLATAGEDRLIRIWDLDSLKCLYTLPGHTDRIPALAWHPTEHYLVSAGWDTTARIWQPPHREPLMLLNSHSEQVLQLAFSPDGQFLVCADSEDVLHIWTAPRDGRVLHVLPGHRDEIRALAFSADGAYLASGGADAVIHLWQPATGHLVAGLDSNDKPPLLYLPEVQRDHGPAQPARLGCGVNGSVQLWEIASGKPCVEAPRSQDVLAAAASPDGRWLATSGTSPQIRVWDALTYQPHVTFEHTRGPLPRLCFSPDSRRLASASASDGLVWLWELGQTEAILVIPEAAASCTLEALAWHPNNRWLAVGGLDWLMTSGADGAICLWDIDTREKIVEFEGGVVDLAMDPTGRLLAGAALRRSILVWDLQTQELAFELGRDHEPVHAVAFSPDGNWLVSGGADHTLRVWSTLDGRQRRGRELESAIQALAFSSDGKSLFVANANTTCYQLDFACLLAD